MKQLLAALGNDIRPSGKNWTARCPVHSDKDFAMSIRQDSNGCVLAHCHACNANGLDLYKVLNLDLEELFGGRKLETDKQYIPHQVKDTYDLDKRCIEIFDASENTTFQDKKRYRLAQARMKGIEEKYNI